VRIQLDRGAVQAMLTDERGLVGRDIRRRGERVQAVARSLAPVRTGRLRASITVRMVRVGGRPSAVVGTDVPYARYQHDGTGIYRPGGTVIRPRTASVLRFVPSGGGGVVYARYVRGTPGTHFLARALPAAGDNWSGTPAPLSPPAPAAPSWTSRAAGWARSLGGRRRR